MQSRLSARRPLHRQRGLTSVEYAVFGGLLIVIVVLAMTPLGAALKAAFDAMLAYF